LHAIVENGVNRSLGDEDEFGGHITRFGNDISGNESDGVDHGDQRIDVFGRQVLEQRETGELFQQPDLSGAFPGGQVGDCAGGFTQKTAMGVDQLIE
jgi:hypothetical protein